MADTHHTKHKHNKLFSAWDIVRFLKNIRICSSQDLKYGLTLKEIKFDHVNLKK